MGDQNQQLDLYTVLVTGKFQCRICPKTLDSLDKMADHILDHLSALETRGHQKKEVIRQNAKW